MASSRSFFPVYTNCIHKVRGRASEEVPIDRFRGNLVIQDTEAFAEDTWAGVRIGTQVFRCAGPCQRCTMICVNQVLIE